MMKKRNNFNDSQKTFIWNRQKGRCGSCGADLSNEVDIKYHHVLNCKDGGVAIVENGVMLCEICHLHSHDNDFTKPVFVFRSEFKYANWKDNIYYKGRKKGKDVEFTKATLNNLDKIGEQMSNQNYESHLRMINKLKQTLENLQNTMKSLKSRYKRQIDAMESATFMDNYIIPLRGKYEEFSNLIESLQDMIDEHKQQISLHEETLEHLIIDARS
jgi:archaellum component FlaC